MDETNGPQTLQLRKLFLLADEIGLTRTERIELSCYLLRRDITTWKQLDDAQVCRMLDALEGWQLIQALNAQRPPPKRGPER